MPKSAPELKQPQAGTKVVTGCSLGISFPVRVKVFKVNGTLIEQRDVIPNGDSSIVVGFTKNLLAGQIVQAYFLKDGVEGVPSGPVAVRIADPPKVADASSTPASTGQWPASSSDAAAVKPGKCDDGSTESSLGLPSIQGAKSNSTELNGDTILKAGKLSVCVNGAIKSIADSSTPTAFNQSLEFASGVYKIKLAEALKTNQAVLVVVESGDGKQRLTKIATVSAGRPATMAAKIRGDLVPGQTSVLVNATPTVANSGYQTRLYPCMDGSPAGVRVGANVQPYAVTDDTGQAAITFEQPLFSGEAVRFCQKIVDTSDTAASPVEGGKSNVVFVTDPLDLGRSRYYFTSGVVLSNNHGFQIPSAGTTAGLFLGLNGDRSWAHLDDEGFRRWNVNTYIDARLTSVATQQAATVAGSNQNTTIQNFTESQKAASFQGGIYVPIVVGEGWRVGRNNYSLFFAPLTKLGFTTLTDEQTLVSAQSSAATVTTLPVTNRFFKSYSFGTRLGIFQHFPSRGAAPQIVSYIDISVGRFGDFEAFRDLTLEPGNKRPALGVDEFRRFRPWRYSLEGLLKVPHSPFVVGFNANIGTGATPPAADEFDQSIPRPYTQPRDDLRFLFGAQFDFSKFLKAIPQL